MTFGPPRVGRSWSGRLPRKRNELEYRQQRPAAAKPRRLYKRTTASAASFLTVRSSSREVEVYTLAVQQLKARQQRPHADSPRRSSSHSAPAHRPFPLRTRSRSLAPAAAAIRSAPATPRRRAAPRSQNWLLSSGPKGSA